ncbi:protein of unknown function [Xenorhabdus poinarii G6]|uniref:Uncharacterized protein n=1 Tax=Xenorhabdus poinarii G6 TaxID=1354304 RepID=A0A068R6A9_9GAMM|nr:protein of unknown function [Xenorhabdus poinarii G6]
MYTLGQYRVHLLFGINYYSLRAPDKQFSQRKPAQQ